MKFSAITTLLAATGVSAAPAAEKKTNSKNAFQLMSLRSASPIHFGSFSAAQSNLFINLPNGKQAAKCPTNPHGVATFYIQDGGLYLYSNSDKPQQVYVDRSGMGQGHISYLPKGEQAPKNAEFKGWASKKEGDYEYLNFKGKTLIACPNSIDNAWSVWLDVGVANPGGNKGCLGLEAMVQPDAKPVSCQYSQ